MLSILYDLITPPFFFHLPTSPSPLSSFPLPSPPTPLPSPPLLPPLSLLRRTSSLSRSLILSVPPLLHTPQLLEENKRLRGERVEDGTVTVDKPLALDEDELEFLEAVEQVSQ
ncbi:unnamed protein product [Closterium sp. NIES-65]|nr:unnamed protein product [Closterium sp. NIES-65]